MSMNLSSATPLGLTSLCSFKGLKTSSSVLVTFLLPGGVAFLAGDAPGERWLHAFHREQVPSRASCHGCCYTSSSHPLLDQASIKTPPNLTSKRLAVDPVTNSRLHNIGVMTPRETCIINSKQTDLPSLSSDRSIRAYAQCITFKIPTPASNPYRPQNSQIHSKDVQGNSETRKNLPTSFRRRRNTVTRKKKHTPGKTLMTCHRRAQKPKLKLAYARR
jgi:hypothetical protein